MDASLPLSEGHFSRVFLGGHELDDVRRQVGAELYVRAAVTAHLVVARRRKDRQHLPIHPSQSTVSCQVLTQTQTIYITIFFTFLNSGTEKSSLSIVLVGFKTTSFPLQIVTLHLKWLILSRFWPTVLSVEPMVQCVVCRRLSSSVCRL